MKTTILAAAIVMTAGMVQAADINVAGTVISVGGEVDANYTTGLETFAVDFTQSVGVKAWGVDLSAEHDMDLLKLNDAGYDLFQGLDFEAGYSLTEALRGYGKVSMDNDFEFGNVTTGLSFAF
jgi:hypothetical protein